MGTVPNWTTVAFPIDPVCLGSTGEATQPREARIRFKHPGAEVFADPSNGGHARSSPHSSSVSDAHERRLADPVRPAPEVLQRVRIGP